MRQDSERKRSEETTLIKKCLDGNQKACRELYDTYKGYMYTICVRYGVPDIDRKDMMQVIFSEVFRSLDRYDDEKAGFKTWLSRVGINHILSYFRKHRNRDLPIYDIEVQAGSSENVLDQISYKELLSLISLMPESYRDIFNMVVLDGYTHKEVSEELEISEELSRVLLFRGRKWMKVQLGKIENGDSSLRKVE